ncbi:hypothetical protein VKT23_020506 [Stygiomarasmius scandens]|uniref:Peptidase C15, pyroglutamyl peptidase I-like protein n=1 Tax=Marasmiellus scandens TaxID=2682957 RepID=A0ABR1IIX7_9AGAR
MTAIKHRVLITGYGPFRQYKQNPSWLAVRTLHNTVIYTPNHGDSSSREPIHITSLEIPVVYSEVLDIIPGLHAAPPVLPSLALTNTNGNLTTQLAPPPPQDGYTLIIHVGVAGPTELRVELFGDKTGYDLPDHLGKFAPVVGERSPDPDKGEEGDEPVPVRGFGGEKYGMFPERLGVKVDVDTLLEDCAKEGKTLVTSTDAGHYLCDFILYCSLAESKMAGRNTPVMFIHCPPVGRPLSTEQVAEGLKSIVSNVCARLG